MQEIIFYRGADEFIRIKPDDGCNQLKEVNGQNVVNISFKDSRYINFQLGDYIRVFPGTEWQEVYKINRLPIAQKTASIEWQYSFSMESEAYDLAKVSFMGLDSGNNLTEPEHSLMGTAQVHLDLLLQNIHRIDPDFTLGEVIETTDKLITYQKETAYNALVKIAETFGTEFWVRGKKISLTKVQQDRGRLYMQGQGKGLYTITREAIEDRNIATRLYAYGSDKNLPPNYLSSRLRLPTDADPTLVTNVTAKVSVQGSVQDIVLSFTPPTAPGVNALQIEYRPAGSTGAFTNNTAGNLSPRTIQVPVGEYEIRFTTITAQGSYTSPSITVTGDIDVPLLAAQHQPYLEKNVNLYGVIEYTEYFDVYPSRTGTVTGVDATSPFKVVDTDIDFNINDYLLPTPAKITFNTGQLAGYTFNIQSYDDATKTIVFLKNADEKAMDVPNDVLRPAIGDTYVLTDIQMPQEYIVDAEKRLKAEAEKFLEVCSVPQVRYKVDFDPVYLRRNKYMPVIGELIWIKDEQFNMERKIRVTATNRSIVNEWDISVEMADVVTYGTINRITSGLQTNTQDIENLSKLVSNRDIFNGRAHLPVASDVSALKVVYIDPNTGQLFRMA